MRVEQWLRTSAERFGDKTALVVGGRRLSYRELDDASTSLSASLRIRGIESGDRVAIFINNSWEAVAAVFACLKAGAVFCPIHPSSKADKLAYILNSCRARAIFAQGSVLPIARAAVAQAPLVTLTIATSDARDNTRELTFEDALAEGQDSPTSNWNAGIDPDLAMLIYTSGSMGVPKGVMMTHQNIDAAATPVISYLENTADDVILSTLPLAFSYGLYQVLTAVKVGATVVLEKSFTFPQKILEALETEKVTGFPLVPTMASRLLQIKNSITGTFPNLRYITNAAAAIPPAHIKELRELFPSTRIFSMYGQTECKRCTYLPPEELDRRPDSVGIAIPGTEAYVVDDAGRRVPPGVVGELVVRGRHIMQGYWEDPEATAKALRPGPVPGELVLYTGDLFKSDADGFLYFVGRKDEIIKSRGEKVAPKEVEKVLFGLPGVREAAVVGVPDALLGMAIKAILVVDPPGSLEPRDIARHCARHLDDYMVPQHFEFRDELPKTESGKVRRLSLMET